MGRIAEDCIAAAGHGPADLLVTDAGSTKADIVAAVEASSPARLKFVAAHPIAGSEKSGVEAASADLFVDRCCILATTERHADGSSGEGQGFWSSLGCRLSEMSPEAHDHALALTSHLPHVVASALAGSVPARLLQFSAGAFRDGTRVAASDAPLWAEIFLANRTNLLRRPRRFRGSPPAFRDALTSPRIPHRWSPGGMPDVRPRER